MGEDDKELPENVSGDETSVIYLSNLDYEKIAELQTKFDKFNQPKSLKIDREYSIAHILSNMEIEKITELKAKFEAMGLKKAVVLKQDEENVYLVNKDETSDVMSRARKKSLQMEDFRKTRRSIEANILHREIDILNKKIEFAKRVQLKTLYSQDNEKEYVDQNLMQFRLKSFEDESPEHCIRTSIDNACRKITRNYSSFTVWRLENLNLIPLPKEQHGTFYEKNCYIIFVASEYGQPFGVGYPQGKEIHGKTEQHLHCWIGQAASAETISSALYIIVELDVMLGGSSTQHREVQGYESTRFKSYFKNGMRNTWDTHLIVTNRLIRGRESVITLLGAPFEPRLFQVRGIRSPVLSHLPDISWEHFSSADNYILQTEEIIFIWIGRLAQNIEKLHATKFAIHIGKLYDTPHIVFIDDGYEKTLYDDDREEFEKYLPLRSRQVKTGDESALDNSKQDAKHREIVKLYHCCEHNNKYRITEIKSGPLEQENLNHDAIMIVDNGLYGVWIWVGKSMGMKDRNEAIRNARGFVKKKKYPNYVPITRVLDERESVEFKNLFTSWVDKEDPKNSITKKKVAVIKVTKFDVMTMYDHPTLAAKSQLVDDGSGSMRIWRIKRFETVEMNKERFGIFFTGDCYVILYTYDSPLGKRVVVYYWMGYHSTMDDQGVAALKAIDIDDSKGKDKAIHGRVWQGKEPAHFLALFKGRMRVFNGRGTDFDISGKNQKSPTHYLLRIEGTAIYNTRATQVPVKSSSLNSNYCFVLRKGSTYYIWSGTYSTGDNREMAKGFVGSDFVLLLEGSETADFWQALCGKTEYTKTKLPDKKQNSLLPRLYHISTKIEIFEAREILYFRQQDLYPESVMLLDARHTIYIWIGNQTTTQESTHSFENALEYLRSDPCGRDVCTPIIQIKQDYEPPTFTGFFEDWNPDLWEKHKTYSELREEIEMRTGSVSDFLSRSSVNSEFEKHTKYSVDVLRGPRGSLPTTVDPERKELHLTYDDFLSLFSMEFKDFEQYPAWKQIEMKKQVGLF